MGAAGGGPSHLEFWQSVRRRPHDLIMSYELLLTVTASKYVTASKTTSDLICFHPCDMNKYMQNVKKDEQRISVSRRTVHAVQPKCFLTLRHDHCT